MRGMARFRSLALLMTISFAACAPVEWAKPGSSPDQAAQDRRFCELEASKEALAHAPARFPASATLSAAASGASSAPDLAETARLANFCMRSKGYAAAGGTGAR